MRPRNPRLLYASLVALVVLFAIGGSAAAATFFQSITVGKNDKSSKIYLQGPISNPGKYPDGSSLPINVDDNLAVTGTSSFKKAASFSKDVTIKGDVVLGTRSVFRSPSAMVSVDDDLNVTGESYLADTNITGALNVTGTTTLTNLNVTGGMSSGSVDVFRRLNDNQTATNALYKYIDCTQQFAAIDGYLEYNDMAFCWNIWIAGRVSDPAVP